MTALEILHEWRRGCGNTLDGRPWRCRVCTWAMLKAVVRQVLRGNVR